MSDAQSIRQTLVAFDYGLRHIGVAVGQQLIRSSNPAGIVRGRPQARTPAKHRLRSRHR